MWRINSSDYLYDLPENNIAKYPLSERDKAKLLVYQEGNMAHKHFADLPMFLKRTDILYFNNTRVLPARIYFQKETGATIEILLLQPEEPTSLLAEAMAAKGNVIWKCAIGNKKRWRAGQILTSTIGLVDRSITLSAQMRDTTRGLVTFWWQDAELTFTDVLEAVGEIPLPPYIHRKASENDKIAYQTIYGDKIGAVAAPTAGLHFTKKTLSALEAADIKSDMLTLHVGAGTFKPIKVANATRHDMHREEVIITQQNLENMLRGYRIGAVGTTTVRTLESVYWFGVHLLEVGKDIDFYIEKLFPYKKRIAPLPSKEAATIRVWDYLKKHKLQQLIGVTEIFILPGYSFQMVDFLITNFHQPKSTLILLVAAFIGEDWKKVYEIALEKKYRFLSYGDSTLLFRNQ